MTAGATPAPLVPPDVDLNDFAFMPVDVERLLKSETWVLGSGDERAAAFALWAQSWHQIPAGSLPDNDRMVAHLSGAKNWNKVRAHAMRGWLLCSDGRRYHPVVCEKALEAWIEKLSNSLSGATGNAKRWGIEVDVSAIRLQFSTAIQMLKALAPQSRTFKKKIVAVVLAGSPPDSPPESPPDTQGASPPESPPDRNRQGHRQGLEETPHTPKGAKTAAVGLKSWLEATRLKGEKPILTTDPVFAYAEEVGLPRDFLLLAWAEFKHRYTQPDAKRYRDWRSVFRKSVRGNWLKLWWLDGQGYALTTVGMQAQRAHQDKAA